MLNATSTITCQMARCFEDRLSALKLIHLAYVRAHLSESSEEGLRVTEHQLLPQSRIFVTKVDGEVATTLSLIPDSRQGLPLEAIYPREVEKLRDRDLRIAEVGCFADRRNDPKRFLPSFTQLTSFMAHYAFTQGIDGFIIAVHPRHARFYMSYLCFEEVGGLVDYPTVRNNPAVALYLDFATAQRREPVRYAQFIGEPVPESEFLDGEMPRWEAGYFTRVIEAQTTKAKEACISQTGMMPASVNPSATPTTGLTTYFSLNV